VVLRSRPTVTGYERGPQVNEKEAMEEEQLQSDQDPQASRDVETPDADSNRRKQRPDPSIQNPDYEPGNSPRSKRELATTPIAPPMTRSRARLQMQENHMCKSQRVMNV